MNIYLLVALHYSIDRFVKVESTTNAVINLLPNRAMRYVNYDT